MPDQDPWSDHSWQQFHAPVPAPQAPPTPPVAPMAAVVPDDPGRSPRSKVLVALVIVIGGLFFVPQVLAVLGVGLPVVSAISYLLMAVLALAIAAVVVRDRPSTDASYTGVAGEFGRAIGRIVFFGVAAVVGMFLLLVILSRVLVP